MAWYRAGSVSVTNGSTAVTGSGTSWVDNVKSGHVFVGPDGLSYEVVTVVSATAMTIYPAYRGATASEAGYGILPTQVFVRELADAVQELVAGFSLTTMQAATTPLGVGDYVLVGQGGALKKALASGVLADDANPPQPASTAAAPGGTVTLDPTSSGLIHLTLSTASTQIKVGSISDPNNTYREFKLVVQQGAGSNAVTWGANITHVPATPVTSTMANKRDFFTLRTFDNGVKWYCFAEGGGVA